MLAFLTEKFLKNAVLAQENSRLQSSVLEMTWIDNISSLNILARLESFFRNINPISRIFNSEARSTNQAEK